MKKALSVFLIGVLIISVVGWFGAWIGAMLFNNTVVEDLHLVSERITTW